MHACLRVCLHSSESTAFNNLRVHAEKITEEFGVINNGNFINFQYKYIHTAMVSLSLQVVYQYICIYSMTLVVGYSIICCMRLENI
jgi:hypothetical protein